MALPDRSLTILDVGHGNCAVIKDPQGTIIVDAGPGTALLEFLDRESINSIEVILISHADKDHLSGLLALIGTKKIKIGCVRLNTDSLKGSRI